MYQIRRRRSATLIPRAVKQFSVINPHGGDGLGYSILTPSSHAAERGKWSTMYADELSGTVPAAGVSWKRCKAQRAGFTAGP